MMKERGFVREVILINKAMKRKRQKGKFQKSHAHKKKNDERKKKMFRGGGKHFSFALRFFFFTLVQFSSFKAFKGYIYAYILHPPTSSGEEKKSSDMK